MKELTIEQKAQRYNEAFRIAQELYNNSNSSSVGKGYVCTVFPELKESEDEKIKKALIDYFDDANKADENPLQSYGIHTDKAIAWLEKQGEQKYTKKDVDDAYLKGVTDTKNEIEKQYEASYQIRKDIATFIFKYKGDIKDRAKWMDYLGIKVSFVEMQGEQKSADKIKPKFHEGDKIHCKLDDRTFVIKEVDLENGVYRYTENGCGNDIDYADEMFELVEQKPTWSEEDENRINRLIAYFEDKESFSAEDDIVYANWLKSLRPQKQWKPSKEQMEALWNVYEGGEKQSALASLYNDLKKL